MTKKRIARHKTARARSELSRPVRLAHECGLIGASSTLLDYGCGRGDDLRHLGALGIDSFGWDPAHYPEGVLAKADVVNLGYVVNVIEDQDERAEVLQDAWGYAEKLMIVSARLTTEEKAIATKPFRDGHLTTRDTFQKFYTQDELRNWIDNTLAASSVAAAPGVFLVFREESTRQSYIASLYRRQSVTPQQRLSDILFEKHRDILGPLMAFVAQRGRLPSQEELPGSSAIEKALGSLRRAFGVVRRATGAEQWDSIKEERSQDLLVYLALSRFSGRPRLSDLPEDLCLDVKGFFGRYTEACAEADRLLFSAGNMSEISAMCKSSPCGKLTADSLYVHVSALPYLPAVLRVYEGCARNYMGAVEGANIIKLHRQKPKVSYLCYPDFDKDPHPSLSGALVIPLQTFDVKYYDWSESENPPILHRKELFVPEDYPGRDKFRKLTDQEERWGLLEDNHSIGTYNGWVRRLKEKGACLKGHRLVSE